MQRVLSITVLISLCIIWQPTLAEQVSSIAMHGDAKYPDGFEHFDYVNPDANKGGSLRMHAIGSFDSLHPFVAKGNSATGIGLIYDTLTYHSEDEPFSQYGLLAESFEIPEDRSWVTFYLNPKARFSDGEPVTAEDVEYSFNSLINKGSPLYRFYYADVDKVTIIDTHTIRFDFKPSVNPELALIIGQVAVLPKHFWQERDFSKPTRDKVIGSGPYVIDSFDINKTITYRRNPDYWGKDLAVNKGRNNFDTISYDYYLDETVTLEAFKSGSYDFRLENSSKLWATGYNFPAVERGDVLIEQIDHQRTAGMQAFVYNIRRPIFQDRRVREALSYAFDFEWSNKNLFFGAYQRSNSYFANSPLASRGLPSKQELEFLEPLKDQLPEEVFSKEFQPPKTDGSGRIRDNLKIAVQLLRRAGWNYSEGKLVNDKGEHFSFEILIVSPTFERVVNPFKKNLERLGIDASVRLIETTQYINRRRDYDYDMIIATFGQSESPGNEQRDYWGSKAADLPGSRNFIGVKNQAIDQLIEHVIAAHDRPELESATRALDRALLWNHYVIPQWYASYDRIAYWKKLQRPQITPSSGVSILNWWTNEK